MLRPLFIAIFREYQYLKIYRALLYRLSIINGRIYNVNMLLKQQCYVKIIITYERLKFVAVNHLQSEIVASLIEVYIWTFRVNLCYLTL